MSQDWKEQKRKQLERESAERKLAEYAQWEKAEAENERREQRLKAELGRNFQCHVCTKRAEKPGHFNDYNDSNGSDDARFVTKSTWDYPGDLSQCIFCNYWTCDDCLLNDVCKFCWQEQPEHAASHAKYGHGGSYTKGLFGKKNWIT